MKVQKTGKHDPQHTRAKRALKETHGLVRLAKPATAEPSPGFEEKIATCHKGTFGPATTDHVVHSAKTFEPHLSQQNRKSPLGAVLCCVSKKF